MKLLAETIRSHKNISELTIDSTEHKINLFADDIILMFTNLAPSLAQIQTILSNLSNISYYKVNAYKSFILDVGVSSSLKTTLQTQYPYL